MPTYEYQCRKCAHRFEVFQQMTQAPLKTCPECQGPLQRLIGKGAGFIFKGSGFYTTDYRSKEYKDRQRQESKPADTQCPASGSNKACKKCPKNKDA
ncbi:MAG: zinc ribbon domain-containing protein [Candidatus Omnitrophica bacterium]|nr:zinc ribbon domain-containing protein [Candidatus Omnitrophota bacterium]